MFQIRRHIVEDWYIIILIQTHLRFKHFQIKNTSISNKQKVDSLSGCCERAKASDQKKDIERNSHQKAYKKLIVLCDRGSTSRYVVSGLRDCWETRFCHQEVQTQWSLDAGHCELRVAIESSAVIILLEMDFTFCKHLYICLDISIPTPPCLWSEAVLKTNTQFFYRDFLGLVAIRRCTWKPTISCIRAAHK